MAGAKKSRVNLKKNQNQSNRGGARPGAGRRRGSRGRRTAELLEKLEALGADPVEVLVATMNETEDERLKADCAAKLLPYTYPRLNSVSVDVKERQTIVTGVDIGTGEGWVLGEDEQEDQQPN